MSLASYLAAPPRVSFRGPVTQPSIGISILIFAQPGIKGSIEFQDFPKSVNTAGPFPDTLAALRCITLPSFAKCLEQN